MYEYEHKTCSLKIFDMLRISLSIFISSLNQVKEYSYKKWNKTEKNSFFIG